jgi:dTDP-4-dehydrorhamnose 3,5-epimerase
MHVRETSLIGAWIVEHERLGDERGSFERCFSSCDFADQGLPGNFVQTNLSRNLLKGTLRGMHFQRAPMAEGKLVQCIHGAVYDVIIDLRPESSTFCQWFGIELNDSKPLALYVPPGMAHGYQVLSEGADVLYHMTAYYSPECAAGVRWDDPRFNIQWPLPVSVISERDKNYGDWR